jgi:predicted kinase
MVKEIKSKEPWVLIMIGPPLSGKTSWINKNFSPSEYELISRDQIVVDIHGEDDYNSAFKSVNQKEVDRVLTKKLVEVGSSSKNAIVDMTHMTRKRRIQNLSYFKNHRKIAIIFPILSDGEYQRRNDKRSGEENKTIPSHVIKNMISSYQTISYEEGFDKVYSLS